MTAIDRPKPSKGAWPAVGVRPVRHESCLDVIIILDPHPPTHDKLQTGDEVGIGGHDAYCLAHHAFDNILGWSH